MEVAEKAMALTAVRIFENPGIVEVAEAEHSRPVGPDFVYKPLVGDRAPPLDYRKTR